MKTTSHALMYRKPDATLKQSPVRVVLLTIQAVPVDLSEFDARTIEEIRVDFVEAEHAADDLLVEKVVAVHGLRHDACHLR